MKKIIAAFDGLKYSESTRDYAIYVSKLLESQLVGVFLEDITYTSYKIYDLVAKEGVSEGRLRQLEEKDQENRDRSVADFKKWCTKAAIDFTVHRDRNIAIQELLHESIYADLLIINRSETLTHYREKLPTRYIRDLLSEVQCPVLVVPEQYQPLKKILMLYDGEPSSVYAIKMFSYLLSPLLKIKTEVLTVSKSEPALHVPDNRLMKEFMKRHFPKALYKVVKGIPEDLIINNLKKQTPGTWVVLGAYRRSTVSRWFRASMADALMKNLNLPLFIAHNK